MSSPNPSFWKKFVSDIQTFLQTTALEPPPGICDAFNMLGSEGKEKAFLLALGIGKGALLHIARQEPDRVQYRDLLEKVFIL